MSNERKMIYLCLAHMSDEGLEQKYIKEAFDTNWVAPLGPNVVCTALQSKSTPSSIFAFTSFFVVFTLIFLNRQKMSKNIQNSSKYSNISLDKIRPFLVHFACILTKSLISHIFVSHCSA